MRRLLLVLAVMLVMSVVAAPSALAKGGGNFCYPYDSDSGEGVRPADSCGNKSIKECRESLAAFKGEYPEYPVLGECINIKRT